MMFAVWYVVVFDHVDLIRVVQVTRFRPKAVKPGQLPTFLADCNKNLLA